MIYVAGVPQNHVLEGIHRVTITVTKCRAHSSTGMVAQQATYPLMPGLPIRSVMTLDWETNDVEKTVKKSKITPNICDTGNMIGERDSVFLFSDITHPDVIDCVESITALVIPLNAFTEDIVRSYPEIRRLPKDWYLVITRYPKKMECKVTGDTIVGIDMSAMYWHDNMTTRPVIDCNLAFLTIPGREVKAMNEYCGNQGLLIAGQCCTGSEHCIAKLE